MADPGRGDHAAVFCDANIVIRILTGDIRSQAEQAAHALEANRRVVLTDVVLGEVCDVLTGGYGFTRVEVVGGVGEFLSLPSVEVVDHEVTSDALAIWRDLGVDFADAYLAALARHTNRTAVLSFDRDFDRIEGVERIDPRTY